MLSAIALADSNDAKNSLMNNYWIDIGTPRSQVLDKLLTEADVSYYNDEIIFTKYSISSKPYGVIAHLFRYKFENNKLIHSNHAFGKWVNLLKTNISIDESDAINAGLINKIENLKCDKKTTSLDSGKEIEFKLGNSICNVRTSSRNGLSGDIQIFDRTEYKNTKYTSEKNQWFGLGYIEGDSIVKVRKTNSITRKDGEQYLWIVNNEKYQNQDLFIKTIFPGDVKFSDLPPGAKYDKQKNALTVPFGKHGKTFSAQFGTDASDPTGTYVMYLTTSTDSIAAISYKVNSK